MDQLVLNIKQPQKLSFIKELLAAFDYVELVEIKHDVHVADDISFAKGLEESIDWVNQHKDGKITQHKTFEQLLNEL